MKRYALFLIVGGLFAAALARDAVEDWVGATVLPPLTTQVGAEVLARDGTLLRAYTVADGRWRMGVTVAAVDPDFVRMLIGFEDKRFYTHHGIDPLAMARAAWQSVWNGRVVSGGSTLSMQVARLLENSGTGRWTGKLRQIRVVLALERRMDKGQILDLYLNRAPYGGNIEGIRAATRAYFGKEPHRLTPAQAALLVALPQSPEARRPDRAPDAARVARDRVLARLAKDGVIAAEAATAATGEAVPDRRHPFPALAPHLADRVVGAEPSARVHRLTVDAGIQASLETLAAMAVRAQGARLQVAIVVAEHRTGQVLASVGSAAYRADGRQGFIDMTRAIRSPGSTLKPLVYGLAMDEGLVHPETLLEDRPTAFGTYMPQNFDGQYRGTIRLREALQHSLNIPAVVLTDAIGPAALMAGLRRAGIDPVVPGGRPGLAVALGGVGVTLENLVQLYAAIARGGEPVALAWATGSVQAKSGRRVLSDVAAWQLGDILSGGTGPAGTPRVQLAFKTGTSYGHRDAWAIGYDGRHVVGVWMGRPDGTPVPGAFGGDLAAPVLFDAFARIKPALDPLPPPPPGTLMVANAQLPAPLQRFRGREALFLPDRDAPEVAFPPDGSLIETGGALVLKVRDGVPPFTWLADGTPVAVATYDRQSIVDWAGTGFLSLSVIDAKGRAARADVQLR